MKYDNKTIKIKHFKSKKLSSISLLIFSTLFSLIPLLGINSSAFAASGTNLSVSPSSQSVSAGSNVNINVVLNPGSSSIGTVVTVFSYSASDFNFVNITSNLGNLIHTEAIGSVSISAATTNFMTTTTTIATITLQAKNAGTSTAGLSGVCPSGDYNTNCSSAYDSTTSSNDLTSVTNGSLAVTAATAPSNPTCPSGDTGTYPNCILPSSDSGNTSKTTSSTGSGTQASGGSSSTSTTKSSTTTATPTSPAPLQAVPAPNTPSPASGSTTSASEAESTYTISVKVLNSDGKPVSGATVNLNGELATTNSTGVASLRAYSGGYTITVSGHGIKSYTSKINVMPEASDQQFTVEAKSSSNTVLIISIVVIIILALLGGGFYYLKKMNKNGTPGSDGLVGGPKDDSKNDAHVAKDPNVIQPHQPVADKVEVPHPPLAINTEKNPLKPKVAENKIEVKPEEPKAEVAKVDINTIHPKFEPNIKPTSSNTIVRPSNPVSSSQISASKIHVN